MINRKELRMIGSEQVRGNVFMLLLINIAIYFLSAASAFTGIGPILVGGPFTIGGILNQKKMAQGEKADFSTAIAGGFKHAFLTSILLNLLMVLYLCLWALLFFIPAIIKTYSYAMSNYILADEPTIGANEAITKSRQMMNGYKWKFFVLQLSWFWHYVLCCITFGIYGIWLSPKIAQANYNFYLTLKEINKAAPAAGTVA